MTEVAAKGGGESDKGRWEKDSTALAAATFAFPDEAAAHAFIQANRAQTHSCSNYKQPTDRAGDVTLTPGDLSFPTLGDETYAAHVKVEVASVDGDFDYVWVRKGPNVTAVAMGGTFVDIDELEQLTNLAVAKLPA